MHSKNKAPTKAELRRLEIITREIGCLPCSIDGREEVPADANHIIEGYRKGHSYTIPECPWHHRGHVPVGYSLKGATKTFGPSRFFNPGSFSNRYGSDMVLWNLTQQRVERFEAGITGGAGKAGRPAGDQERAGSARPGVSR